MPGVSIPFGNEIRYGGQSGLSIAARWFLDRGYIVPVPLEPALYDLITESDSGLKRVQVKSTRQVQPNGRCAADIGRRAHDASARRNANGNRRRVPYDPADVDYFFIIAPTAMYLIPVELTDGRCQIVLDEKYSALL